MKKFTAFILAVLMLLSFTACSGEGDEITTEEPTQSDEAPAHTDEETKEYDPAPDFTVYDKDGNKVNWADNVITAQLSGLSATVAGIENGCGFDVTPYSSPSRKVHNGNAVIYIKATDLPGDATLTVTANNLQPATVKITTK